MIVKDNKTLLIFIATLILGVAFFIGYNSIKTNKDFETITKEKEQIEIKLDKYRTYADSVTQLLIIYEDSIVQLNHTKSKIKTVYETRIQNALNPTIFTNDSIIEFLSGKVHCR